MQKLEQKYIKSTLELVAIQWVTDDEFAAYLAGQNNEATLRILGMVEIMLADKKKSKSLRNHYKVDLLRRVRGDRLRK